MRRDYPGASKFKDRHGKWRWRARAKGKPTVMLHGEYGSAEFVAAWQSWANGKRIEIGASKTRPGSIGALIAGYYESSDFKLLAENTRRLHRSHLERLRGASGGKDLKALTRENVVASLDKMASTPASANNFLKVMRALCRYAVDRNMIVRNPAAGVKRLRDKTDGIHTWTDEQIAQFELRHPTGTKANLALNLFLFTAQRKSDVIRLGKQHERDGALHLRQQKTGAKLILPIVDELRAAIDAAPKGALTYLETEFKRPFSVAGFGNWFSDRCREAGLKGCSAHGLRKAAARRMAEAGKSAHEIMSITGHRTLGEVERYTRAADQEQLAIRAADGLRGANRERNAGKPLSRFANSDDNILKGKAKK